MSSAARAALSRTPDNWSAAVDTARFILPPAFLEALRAAVPRRRRAKVPLIVGAGAVFVLVVLGADASTREFIATRWRDTLTRTARTTAITQPAPQVNPVASPSSMPPPATAIDPAVDHRAAAVASASAIPSVSEPVFAQKKARPRAQQKKAATAQ